MAEFDIRHNSDRQRFETTVDGQLAFVEYLPSNDRLIVTHTAVPKQLEGRGVGSALAKTVLDHARQINYTVIALCPFIAAYLNRHPEYQDISRPLV